MTTPLQHHAALISDLIRRADEHERSGEKDKAKHLRDHIAALKAVGNLNKDDLAASMPSISMSIPKHLRGSLLVNVESTISLFDETVNELFDGAVKPSAIYLLGVDSNLKGLTGKRLDEALEKGQPRPALHISFGADGALSITATSITFIGNTSETPEAILAAMQHAKVHWGRFEFVTKENDDYPKDYYFRFAVAAEMVGVPIVGYEIPEERRARGEDIDIKKDWQKHLDKLQKFITGSPGRPGSQSARRPVLDGGQPAGV